MLEQRKYLEKVIGYTDGQNSLVDKFLGQILDRHDNGQGLVNITNVSIDLSRYRDMCQIALQAIADDQQAQNKLHNDKITNPRTGEKY